MGPQDCLYQQAPPAELPAPGPPPSTLLLDTPALPSALPQGTPPASHTGSSGTPWACASALSSPGKPTFPSEGGSLFPLQRAGQTGCPPDT